MNMKRVIQIICIVLEIICFLPTMTVSCSDESINLSAINGIKGYDEASGSLLYVLLFLLPIVVTILMFVAKEAKEKVCFIAALVGCLVDALVWNAFKNDVFKYVHDYGYGLHVETTNWYMLNEWLIIAAIVLCVVFLLKTLFVSNNEIRIDTDKLKQVVNTEDAGRKLNQVKETMKAVSGAAVVAVKEQQEKHAKEEMERRIEKTRIEQEKEEQESQKMGDTCYCINCGKQINTNMKFCKYCGAKQD